METPSLKYLRVLCLGDSLTAGYTAMGEAHYPYAKILKSHLARLLPSTNIIIDVSGLSGNRVTGSDGQFLSRMEARCAKAAATGAPYDWVIVLGGTNDLGWFEDPEDIYSGLEDAWKVALNAGAKVLALSVTECAALIGDIGKNRKQLNELIANHTANRWFYMDLCAAVPYFSMNEQLREEIWDDGLHLTKAGYKMMGDAIGFRMTELLTAEAHQL